MPKIDLNSANKYSSGGSSKSKFFKLADDGDTAQIRFMIESIDDLNDYVYVTHRVKLHTSKGKDIYPHVNCLREYNDPVDDCPLCRSGMKSAVRLFVPVYNLDEDAVQLWDRPKGFTQKLSYLLSRHKNLVSCIFDVVRNGEAGDKSTTYETELVEKDDTVLEDLPEIPDVEGTCVLNKSADDMEYFLSEGEFPPDDEDDEEEVVPRRRSKKDVDEDADEEEDEEVPRRREKRNREERSERRTPARSRRSKEDKF